MNEKAYKFSTRDSTDFTVESAITELPEVDISDNGKILAVVDGEWGISDAIGGLQNLVDGNATGSLRGITAAEETGNYSLGQNSIAVGTGAKASGNNATAFGDSVTASGNYSHAEGKDSTASSLYTHAEGHDSLASNKWAHAEGGSTTSRGQASHAEGGSTTAAGNYSHAEGNETHALGQASHAEGDETFAKQDCAHSEGLGTIANYYQHAEGKYNIEDATETYAFIIGNGTDNNHRSNAFAIKWDGTIVVWNEGTPIEVTPSDLQALLDK